jgi:hypothetical protein
LDQSPELPNNAGRVGFGPLAQHSVFELVLSSVLLFGVVSIVRWVIGPSPISRTIPGSHAELCIVGATVAFLLAGLILSPPGRASGGHMNPAISLAMWRFGVFPGAGVFSYTIAQLLGSVVGVVTARVGPCCGGTAGRICRAPSRAGVVNLGTIRNRSRRHGGHRVRRRALPRGTTTHAVRALDRWLSCGDRDRGARNGNRWQSESSPPAWARCRFGTNPVPMGVLGSPVSGSSYCDVVEIATTVSPKGIDP